MLINEKSPVIKAIGLMSGTSLDGVDLAFCTFSLVDERWTFTTEAAETYSYTDEWLEVLKNLHLQSASKIFEVDAALGRYYGELIKKFIKKNNLHPDLIASHGHTLFHQPEKSFTTQIGSGAHISAITGLSTICDFGIGRTRCSTGSCWRPLFIFGLCCLFKLGRDREYFYGFGRWTESSL